MLFEKHCQSSQSNKSSSLKSVVFVEAKVCLKLFPRRSYKKDQLLGSTSYYQWPQFAILSIAQLAILGNNRPMNENLMKNIVYYTAINWNDIDILNCILQIFFAELSKAFGCVTFATVNWL